MRNLRDERENETPQRDKCNASSRAPSPFLQVASVIRDFLSRQAAGEPFGCDSPIWRAREYGDECGDLKRDCRKTF